MPIRKISLFDLLKSKVKVKTIDGFDPKKINPLNLEKNSREHADAFLKFVFKRFRNTMIHGARTKVQEDTAEFVFNFILACSRALCTYADKQGKPIYGKKIVRRKSLK